MGGGLGLGMALDAGMVGGSFVCFGSLLRGIWEVGFYLVVWYESQDTLRG